MPVTETVDAAPASALDDIRVLDLTSQLGQYAGKLLADLGADVIRLESPTGVEARRAPPYFHDAADLNHSLDFWYFNTSKRSVTLNLWSADGQAIFRRLLARADVVIESLSPANRLRLLPSDEELETLNPGLIRCSVTGFGLWGPHAAYAATDLIGVAMAGILTLAGYPDRAPTMPPYNQGLLSAGVQAAQGILAALLQRDRSGRGQTVEISMQEALSLAQETAMQFWDLRKEVRKRTGESRILPGVGAYPCKDGHVYMMVGVAGFGASWSVLARWLEEAGMADDLMEERWQSLLTGADLRNLTALRTEPEKLTETMAQLAHVNDVLAAFLATKTKQELYEEGQRRRLLIGPVNSAKDLLQNAQLNARAWYQLVPHPELGTTITYPGPPFRSSETGWAIHRRPPLLGEHTLEVLEELGLTTEELTALSGVGVI